MSADVLNNGDSEPRAARRGLWRLVGSLAIGVGLGWMLMRGGLPIVPDARAFERLTPWMVALYVASLLGVHLLRATRWRHLLRPIGHVETRQVLSTAWIGFAAIIFLPLRTGEVVRPLLIARRGEVRAWEAAGTVGAERVIDGLVLSAVFFAALQLTVPLSPLPEQVGNLAVPVAAVPSAAYAALTTFVLCFAALLLFHLRPASALGAIHATLGRLSRKLAARAAGIVERLAKGLAFLPSPARLLPFMLETAGYWALNAGGLWLLARGCGLDSIGLGEACVIMGCLGIGILVPSGPGYFGTYQLSIYLALAMFVGAESVTVEGSAFVFISYMSQLGTHLLGGAVGAVLGWTGRRAAVADADADVDDDAEKLAEERPTA